MTKPEKTGRPGRQSIDELLTLDEVATILKLPPATLRKWRSEGLPPQAFRVGRWLRYRRSVVEAFLVEQEEKERR